MSPHPLYHLCSMHCSSAARMSRQTARVNAKQVGERLAAFAANCMHACPQAFVKHRLAVSNWHGGKIASLSYLLELTAVKARNRICFARSSCPRTASIDMEETLRETLSMLSDMDALWVCFSRYYSRRQLPGWQDLPAVMDPTNMHSNAALPLHDSSAARGAIEGIARGGLAVLNASGATIDDLFNA